MIISAVFITLFLIFVGFLIFLFSENIVPIRLGIIFAAVHFVLILFVSGYIYWGIQGDSETVMLFLLIYALDFPVSFLTLPLNSAWTKFIGNSFMVTNFYIPSLTFLLFGSTQYFLIGFGIGKLVNKLKKRLL